MLGTAVCNGHALDVVAIELKESTVVMHLHGHGPATLEGPVTIFGSDGSGVCQGTYVPRSEIRERDVVRLVLSFKIAQVEESQPMKWNT